MNQMTDFEIGYIAGIVDGEGCFYIANTRQRYFCAQLIVVGTLGKHIKKIASIVGAGSVSHSPRKTADIFRWQITSQEALDLTKIILPHLIAKRDQAKLFCEFQEHMSNSPSYNRYQPIPQEILARRMHMADKLKSMKEFGKTRDGINIAN